MGGESQTRMILRLFLTQPRACSIISGRGLATLPCMECCVTLTNQVFGVGDRHPLLEENKWAVVSANSYYTHQPITRKYVITVSLNNSLLSLVYLLIYCSLLCNVITNDYALFTCLKWRYRKVYDFQVTYRSGVNCVITY